MRLHPLRNAAPATFEAPAESILRYSRLKSALRGRRPRSAAERITVCGADGAARGPYLHKLLITPAFFLISSLRLARKGALGHKCW